jgi:hypothetical protein
MNQSCGKRHFDTLFCRKIMGFWREIHISVGSGNLVLFGTYPAVLAGASWHTWSGSNRAHRQFFQLFHNSHEHSCRAGVLASRPHAKFARWTVFFSRLGANRYCSLHYYRHGRSLFHTAPSLEPAGPGFFGRCHSALHHANIVCDRLVVLCAQRNPEIARCI